MRTLRLLPRGGLKAFFLSPVETPEGGKWAHRGRDLIIKYK